MQRKRTSPSKKNIISILMQGMFLILTPILFATLMDHNGLTDAYFGLFIACNDFFIIIFDQIKNHCTF